MQHHRKRKRVRSNNLPQRLQPGHARSMCYRCMRPTSVCHCSTIPAIDNRTAILIAQHIRERSHPFNTARMVARSLDRCELVIDYPENMPQYDSAISDNAGLLFPGSTACDLLNIPSSQRPDQLIVLDGTWNHVKHLYKNWPALAALPHYKLNPDAPGQYRIRLEPNEYSLSTVEATVLALKILEPNTKGLDELSFSFRTMIDRQLAHPNADYSRSLADRAPTFNFPRSLLNDYQNLVVIYGEAEPCPKSQSKLFKRAPVFWVAKRLVSGEQFSAAIESRFPITKQSLEFFQLEKQIFEKPISFKAFASRWQSFTRPNDILVTYNDGSLRLLRSIGIETSNSIELKSVNFDPFKNTSTLTEFFRRHDVPVVPVEFPGRAGQRLANLTTLIEYLRSRQTRIT